jgi:hypothetical protein
MARCAEIVEEVVVEVVGMDEVHIEFGGKSSSMHSQLD